MEERRCNVAGIEKKCVASLVHDISAAISMQVWKNIGVGDRGLGGCSPPNFDKLAKICHNRAENRPNVG